MKEDTLFNIYDFGLLSDRVIKSFGYDNKTEEPLNLEKFINDFIEVYQYFKADYSKLDKLSIGKDFNVSYLSDFVLCTELIINANRLKDNDYQDELFIKCNHDHIETFAKYNDEEKTVNNDSNLAKEYLDLFVVNYGALFEFLMNIRKREGDFASTGTAKINILPVGYDSNLEGLKVRFTGKSFNNNNYMLDIYLDISTGEINCDLSELYVNGKKIVISKSSLSQIINYLYGHIEISRVFLDYYIEDIEDYCDWLINNKRNQEKKLKLK